jgi:hypothetical protein
MRRRERRQGHGLRATFASIAEELLSSALLKRMLNHAAAGDVTFGHYVAKSEAQLRSGWQALADFVEEAARRDGADPGSPVSIKKLEKLPFAAARLTTR